MRILLHICCANCAIFPIEAIRDRGDEVTGYFFNPNIHPYQEYRRRLEALKAYSERGRIEVIYRDEYLLEEFLKGVAHRFKERCHFCYTFRLEATAREALKGGYDRFSTTLLQSIHQDHQQIREIGERVGRGVGIPFHYEDYRRGWKRGLEMSRALGLYRQSYCGCIYSEKERFMGRVPLKESPGGQKDRKEVS
ncbi:MAG: epoxyqueuosine reductase QueH [Desulfobacterota bacterium]|nr:epoxyqueuosine reductase QueH [Thermodesulfobacteriota bacterium]